MIRLETIICTFSVLSVAARADFRARNCSQVAEACMGRGFSFTNVPQQEIPGKTSAPHLSSHPYMHADAEFYFLLAVFLHINAQPPVTKFPPYCLTCQINCFLLIYVEKSLFDL